MKNIFRLLILVFVTVAFAACRGDKCCLVGPPDGYYYLQSTKNNAAWNTKPLAILNPKKIKPDTVVIDASKGEEHLSIFTKLNSQNKYELDFTKTTFYITVGLDAVVSTYTLDNTAANTINVTVPAEQVTEGSFSLTFKKVTGDANYPGKVIFTNGQFRAAMGIAL